MVDQNELITLAGVFFGGLIAGALSYLKKPKPTMSQDPVLAGIGMELGNKAQMKELIDAVKGIEKAIRDEKQDEMEDKMDALLAELQRKHPD